MCQLITRCIAASMNCFLLNFLCIALRLSTVLNLVIYNRIPEYSANAYCISTSLLFSSSSEEKLIDDKLVQNLKDEYMQ